jgi:hypothetical protein
MSIPDDIDGLSAYAYEQGILPLDWAITSVNTEILAWTHVVIGRLENPESFPGYHPDLTITALARRIVGNLLDAGWRIPGSTELTGTEPGTDGA